MPRAFYFALHFEGLVGGRQLNLRQHLAGTKGRAGRFEEFMDRDLALTFGADYGEPCIQRSKRDGRI